MRAPSQSLKTHILLVLTSKMSRGKLDGVLSCVCHLKTWEVVFHLSYKDFWMKFKLLFGYEVWKDLQSHLFMSFVVLGEDEMVLC